MTPGKEDGSITTATLFIFIAFCLGAAMAIDMLILNAHRSHVQAQADFSALEAVRHVNHEPRAYKQASRSVDYNDLFPARPLAPAQLVLGRYESGVFTPRNQSEGRVNAAHVTAVSDARMQVASLLGDESRTVITRQAVAVVQERVSFSLANCLLSLNLFHGALRPILGTELDAICSEGALFLRTDALLETLSLNLDAPMTYGDVLDADIAVSRILSAAVGAEVNAPDAVLRLSDFVHLDSGARGMLIGTEIPGSFISKSDLVFGTVELFGEHVLDLGLRADLGPVADVPVRLTVVEPRRIVASVEPGTPEAYAETAQIRLDVDGLDLLGLVGLDLSLRIAHAEARLTDRASACHAARSETAAIFDPAQAGLLSLDIRLSALGLTVRDEIDLVQTEELEIAFSARDIQQQRTATFSPRLEGTLADVDSALAGLLGQLPLSGLTTGLVGGLVSPALDSLSPVENLLAAVVHDFVGLAIAPARLTPLGFDCRIALVQ
ncbi:hypothetical protein [Mameliella sediminis]|uniref:hypothetical protein n=1 Tax=Mameliella sediminis TaxID=2836866 RepID=UPI001C47330A|nr:hypothetical protein [Mameliella sediminis]MBV7393135.1 hypothetical protein [Mameliella sediminis]